MKTEAEEIGRTICLDFDLVLHAYTTGWLGDGIIPDDPYPGAKAAVEELRREGFDVKVLSTRCRSEVGRRAVEAWLSKHGIVVDEVCEHKPPALAYIGKWHIRFNGDWSKIVERPISEIEILLKRKHIGEFPKLSDSEWGYIGGLIDGEGCITASHNGQGRIYLRLMVINTHIAVLEWIKSKLGGSVHVGKLEKGQNFPAGSWNRQGIYLLPIFEFLLSRNLLRMKSNQAKFAIQFLRNQRYNGRKETELHAMQQAQLVEAIHSMNKKGVATLEPIVIDDRSIRFNGSWPDTLSEIKRLHKNGGGR